MVGPASRAGRAPAPCGRAIGGSRTPRSRSLHLYPRTSPMELLQRILRPRTAALSCLALVCATGCVSKNSYDHVSFDLEQRTQELARANLTIAQTQGHLRRGLDDLRASQIQTAQARSELAQSKSEGTGLQKKCEELSAELVSAWIRSVELEKRAAQTENQ